MPYSKEENESVTIHDCKGLRFSSTKMALLVSNELWDEDRWIPSSLIHDDSECYAPSTDGTLVVPKWFAAKEGLI